MLITRKSYLSGIVRTRDIPCTQAQLDTWEDGCLIQDAMCNVSAEDREFLISGITPEEWKAFEESNKDNS